MCTPSLCKPAEGSFLHGLGQLSTAEDFFQALGLPFDQKVVSVSRLHILKRFHDLLDIPALTPLDEAAQRTACRAALETAYQEFAAGGGTKTFKVFQGATMGFVPLGSLTGR
ncbi:nitrogenase-stabilizing/protective protein NifW [Magnetospirillum sp. UT-4]|uniref:nitrogenase-stabilizing/protective protein NifW n=1 Tax=Magnetospirillum sp. UT-4 TaxID=2681467 RepID=UPI0013808C32|nr:nitrogenase-stabilizing/protective protein NifW [Magnetospirillum sp. UT-4]CAA7615271.1 Nitrogenase stabilizing/protective protein nifW [Magnetospirillum sp. UT-4]